MSARRDGIDVARVSALWLVILGHLMLAVIDKPGDAVRGTNLLALKPAWAWVATLSPMPVFFAAAGWANATATARSAAPRLRSLVGLGAVVVCCWSAAVIVAITVTGRHGLVGRGARVATQPMWFIAAYAPMAVLGKRIASIGARRPLIACGLCLIALAGLDITRFALDAPDWIGWPGFYLAWGTPWLIGGWWRSRAERGLFAEHRAGLVLAVSAGAAAFALVHGAGYSSALIDAVPAARSNTTPPTLYTAILGLAQTGVLMVAATFLDGLGRRWRRFWTRSGEAALALYAWHLTAMCFGVVLVAVGLVPAPERLTRAWWFVRPLWIAVVLILTGALVAVTGAARSALSSRDGRRQQEEPSNRSINARRVAIGVVLAVAASAGIGLVGPRTAPLATAWSTLFVSSWLVLRPRSPMTQSVASRPRRRTRERRSPRQSSGSPA